MLETSSDTSLIVLACQTAAFASMFCRAMVKSKNHKDCALLVAGVALAASALLVSVNSSKKGEKNYVGNTMVDKRVISNQFPTNKVIQYSNQNQR